MAEPILAIRGLRAGYGRSRAASPSSAATASASRRSCSRSWVTPPCGAERSPSRAGTSPPGSRTAARAGIGWVAQEREIFPSLTVEENLTVASKPGRWDLKAVHALFPRLAERRNSKGNQLSGGEQQMLALARALMTNPSLLLLDEPMEGLAPIIVEEVARAIEHMMSDDKMAVIIVEQHADLALKMTREAILLERGQIVHRAASSELAKDQATLDRYMGLSIPRSA